MEGLCFNRTVTNVIYDGIGQLTFLEQDGHGFLHVGIADGDVTVGCSTGMSLLDCFGAVGRVAAESSDLVSIMGGGETEVFITTQSPDLAPGELDIYTTALHLPSGWQFDWYEFADKVAKFGHDGNDPAVRVDIGKSSWQWDDFSGREAPNRRGFGGLLDQALVYVLTRIVAIVGDDWVQANLQDLSQRINDFIKDNSR